MLAHFYSPNVDFYLTKGLFNNFIIGQSFVEEHQGKYPVVAITFKDIKSSNFNDAYSKLKLGKRA